jgi:predicted  nucleic acid-binding Zn-ribbon protein
LHMQNLTEMKQATKKWDALEVVYEQDKSESQEERECIRGLEQKLTGTYEKIPQDMQGDVITTTENIDWIAQAIDQYQKEIENL